MSAAYQMPQSVIEHLRVQRIFGRPIKDFEPMYSGWFFVEALDGSIWWVHESGKALKSARRWRQIDGREQQNRMD